MKTKRKTGGEGVKPLTPVAEALDEKPEHSPFVRKTIDIIIDQLAPHEVPVPPAWSRHAKPETVFYGRCFERSYHFALNVAAEFPSGARGVWLVHGEFFIWRHAWVELPGDVVFDGVSQRFYDRGGYYETVSARPWYMYSSFAARQIAFYMPRFPDGTWLLGDWDVPLGLPWADPKNPTRIEYEEAVSLLEGRGLKPPPQPASRRRKARSTS